MKHILSLLLIVGFFGNLYAQYPNTSNKMRLGAQTTGDGLIFRTNAVPTWTPSTINNAWLAIDTLTGNAYSYQGGEWRLEVAGDLRTVYPKVINKSGTNIKRGQPVMVDYTQIIQGDLIRVRPADGSGTYSGVLTMGIASTDIANNAEGFITWFGYVREVKESDIAETGVTLNIGDILYLSGTQLGKLTNVEPTAPKLRVTMALVVRKPNANNLTILVRPSLNMDLGELNDVDLTGLNDGETIVWDSLNGKWIAGTAGSVIDTTVIATRAYVNSKVDSTRLVQDSILVYYIGGAELRRDTISGVGGGGGGGTMSSFTLAGSAGTPQTISDGNTLTVTAGVGISTTAGATDQVTVAADTTTVLASKTFLSTRGYTTGSGTTGTIPIWSSSTALGNSALTETSGSVTAGGTGFFRLPNGTTAQRPGTPASGMTRYNLTNGALEYYGASAWEVPIKSATETGLGSNQRVLYFDANGRATSQGSFTWTGSVLNIRRASGSTRNTFINGGNFSGLGNDNIAIGNNSLINYTTGFQNVAIGSSTMSAATTGFNNMAIGRSTLVNLTTGYENTAVGTECFFDVYNGRGGTAIGTHSLRFIRSGDYNTSIGFRSAHWIRSGSLNIFLGAESGPQTAVDSLSGSSNTILGSRAASGLSGTASRNVIIGADINVPLSNTSNQISIANVIFGTGASGTGTTIATGARVGINENAPARTFHVTGEARITDLTTDTPTRIVGADADGDLGAITVGTGLTLSNDTLRSTAAGTTNLSFTGTSSPITLNSDTGTDVRFVNGNGISLTRAGDSMTIAKALPIYANLSLTSTQTLSFLAGSTTPDTIPNLVLGQLGGVFSMDGNGLKYTSSTSRYFLVSVHVSFKFAEVGILTLQAWKTNGGTTIDLGPTSKVESVLGNEIMQCSFTGVTSLANNDILRFGFTPPSHTGNDDLVVDTVTITITEL